MPAVPALPEMVHRVEDVLRRLPGWSRPYVVALTQLLIVVVFVAAMLHFAGAKATGVGALILILFVLCAARHGYGPGILVCGLTFFVLPPILLPNRPHNVAQVQFVVFV